MEMWKGAKPVGVLSEETRAKPILSSPSLLMCMLYTCAKRTEIKSKLVFTFFLLPQPQVSSEREALHAYQCICRLIVILDSQGLGLKCDMRTSHYNSTGTVKCLLNKG